MNETQVDLATLGSIARTLHSGGDAVERLGEDRPGTPDAGAATSLLLAAMAAVTEGAAALCEGLHDAATAVTHAHDEFSVTDRGVSARLTDRLGLL